MQKNDPKDSQAIARMAADKELRERARQLFLGSVRHRYSYNFSWLGRPIIQYPQDMVAAQEVIWRVKPDLIVETGIAHGGSLIFYASLLQLIGNGGRVIGVDVDIREHNRVEIEKHPLFKHITMIQGSAIAPEVVEQVYAAAKDAHVVLVVLDSNHTHEHVLKELELYSPLVKRDSYVIVYDTVVEDLPEECFQDRPWGKGNNPKTAVWEFLKKNDRFEIDAELENKLLLTVAPDGYLRCIKD